MFTRSKVTAEAVTHAAAQHATAAEQLSQTLYSVGNAADEIAHTADRMRAQLDTIVILTALATLAALVTAVVVTRAAAR